tara:strand:- start:459 stop:611 length:153 start_codon:yes stop_codon:yes gene_type:complete
MEKNINKPNEDLKKEIKKISSILNFLLLFAVFLLILIARSFITVKSISIN